MARSIVGAGPASLTSHCGSGRAQWPPLCSRESSSRPRGDAILKKDGERVETKLNGLRVCDTRRWPFWLSVYPGTHQGTRGGVVRHFCTACPLHPGGPRRRSTAISSTREKAEASTGGRAGERDKTINRHVLPSCFGQIRHIFNADSTAHVPVSEALADAILQ